MLCCVLYFGRVAASRHAGASHIGADGGHLFGQLPPHRGGLSSIGTFLERSGTVPSAKRSDWEAQRVRVARSVRARRRIRSCERTGEARAAAEG
jgi:hypothetical protein